jgi:hypothetical protein
VPDRRLDDAPELPVLLFLEPTLAWVDAVFGASASAQAG